MNTITQPGGRSVEDFVGRSDRGDFNEALQAAVKLAKLTLGSSSIRWRLLHFSGVTADHQPDTIVVTIQAKCSAD